MEWLEAARTICPPPQRILLYHGTWSLQAESNSHNLPSPFATRSNEDFFAAHNLHRNRDLAATGVEFAVALK
jgi:hypothetical protein